MSKHWVWGGGVLALAVSLPSSHFWVALCQFILGPFVDACFTLPSTGGYDSVWAPSE